MAKHESMLWLLLMAGQAAAQTLPDPTAAVHEAHPAAAQRDDARLPSFAALEATGARIGEVRVVTRDIFYTDDPAEDRRRFRWANALHVKTRPEVVERALLFGVVVLFVQIGALSPETQYPCGFPAGATLAR